MVGIVVDVVDDSIELDFRDCPVYRGNAARISLSFVRTQIR